MASFFLGIDAGTTIVKTVLFDESGQPVRAATRETDIIFGDGGAAEIDLEVYWDHVVACTRETLAASAVAGGEVQALAVSANGVTFMPVNENGKPLRRSFSYLDQRGSRETAELIEEFGQETLYDCMGQPRLLPLIVMVKVLWMKRHEPEVFRRFYKLVMVDDYLMFRLTGAWATDPSLAGTTGFVTIRDGARWRATMDYVGISPARLCGIRQSGTPIGPVLGNVARELGLSEKTMVVCGTLDQAAGCLGSGNITPGIITECTGTVLALCATVDEPLIDPERPMPCFCHAIPSKFIMLPWCLSGGRVLKWFRDEFFDKTPNGNRPSYADIVQAAESIAAGSDGLLILPHLAGMNTPAGNNNVRGVFFNIDFRHTRGHVVRAILESIGYMLRRNVELLRGNGLCGTAVRAIGGGARSRLWNQIKADILQMPVMTCAVEEVGALGAAILAAVGSGHFESLDQACRQWVRFRETFTPDVGQGRIYNDGYGRYVELENRVHQDSASALEH